MVQVPRPAHIGSAYAIAHAALAPVMSFLWAIEVEGVENVPVDGGAIFAPNHLSVFDHFVLGAALPRQITFVGKAEYLDRWTTKYAFPALGMIPIDRSGGSASQAALDAASHILECGGCFGIYPEGTRSRDGDLHRGRTGVARLSLRTGCPILPVGLQGTPEVQPPDARLPRPFKKVRVRIGRPVVPPARNDGGSHDPSAADDPADRVLLRTMTDTVMHEIAILSGQHYVDTYASSGAGGPGDVAT
jgi:1-acyl-sn-glycerol-3-phosphate acyltransferase